MFCYITIIVYNYEEKLYMLLMRILHIMRII